MANVPNINISDNDVYNALCAFVNLIVPPGTPILRGQTNRVPMPSVDCVILTTIGAPDRIGTNFDQVFPTETLITADFTYSVQVDFYSLYAASWAMSGELLWRDKAAWYVMPAGIKPLYSEGRMQLPLVGAENQWIQRWTLTLVLDYQPTLTLETDSCNTATVIPEPIDVFYPPGTPPASVLATDLGQLIQTDSGQDILVIP
jgi:hypothetical protein